MGLDWTLEGVEFRAVSRARGVWFRALLWTVPTALYAALFFGLTFVRGPIPNRVQVCTTSSDHYSLVPCREFDATLGGEAWPDRNDWMSRRRAILAERPTLPKVPFNPKRTIDDAANQGLRDAALEARRSIKKVPGYPMADFRLHERVNDEWAALEQIRQQTYKANVADAVATGAINPAMYPYTRAVQLLGWLGLLLTPLVFWLPVISMRRREVASLKVTAHQVVLDGRAFPRSEVDSVELRVDRIAVVAKGRTFLSQPIPTALIADADALCAAFSQLEPSASADEVPARLEALLAARRTT